KWTLLTASVALILSSSGVQAQQAAPGVLEALKKLIQEVVSENKDLKKRFRDLEEAMKARGPAEGTKEVGVAPAAPAEPTAPGDRAGRRLDRDHGGGAVRGVVDDHRTADHRGVRGQGGLCAARRQEPRVLRGRLCLQRDDRQPKEGKAPRALWRHHWLWDQDRSPVLRRRRRLDRLRLRYRRLDRGLRRTTEAPEARVYPGHLGAREA